jgi:hypothetical protein
MTSPVTKRGAEPDAGAGSDYTLLPKGSSGYYCQPVLHTPVAFLPLMYEALYPSNSGACTRYRIECCGALHINTKRSRKASEPVRAEHRYTNLLTMIALTPGCDMIGPCIAATLRAG